MISLRGTGTALITPFNKGLVDHDAFSRIIDYNIDGGVEFLVPLGSTGEALTIDDREQREILDRAIKHIDSRVPIVAGNFGGSDTRAQVAKIKKYNFDGISAILISSPAYNKPSQQGIYEHHLIAVKEAIGDLTQVKELINTLPTRCAVLSGDDPTALESVKVGAQGVISVISNALPKTMSQMIRASLNEEWQQAKKLNILMDDFHNWLYIDGNPSGIKAAITHILNIDDELRLPLVRVSSDTRSRIQELINTRQLY